MMCRAFVGDPGLGPAPEHDRMLRHSGVQVHGLDFFYPGYKYDGTTEKVELQNSCHRVIICT